MQPNSPPLSPSNISRFSSPCVIPDHLTAAVLVLVNKPDTHFYPVFHIQKDPPPDISGVNTLGHEITAFDQILMGSDVESDLRMFFAEPKHCSLVIDSFGKIFVLNFSSGNPCLLNSDTLTTNTLHPVVDGDVIHVAGKDFRVEYKPGYPLSAIEAIHEDTTTQLSDTVEPPEDTILVLSPSSSPKEDKAESNYFSLPKITTTSKTLKSATVPHDTTDNSLASMEVNTSQPSLVARDMSMDVSLPEKRRVSDPPKKTIQSPIKLKRKSAPVTHYRTLNQSMETANESLTPRRSSRQVPLRSPTPPLKRSSPRLSAGVHTPRQFPSTFKHPHSTGNSARKSKSLGSRKSVRFGPSLSPEEFYRDMPPSTPLKRGGTPIPKSATKAVLRRSTPYRVPIPLSAQRTKRATKSISSSSPEDSLIKTPTPLSSPKLKTPKSLQILSPVKEVPLVTNPSRPLVNEKPRLRRGFTSGVVSEMVESQNLKLSSRISTPTSLHTKQPTKLLDKGTPTSIHSRRGKMLNLASSQSFVPKKADLSVQTKRISKLWEGLLMKQSPKRVFVSPGNQPSRKESPNILKRSPRLSKSPPPTHSNKSGELEPQRIQRQSPRLSKSPMTLQSPNPSNISGQSESPLSLTRNPRLSKSPVSDPLALVPNPKAPSPHQSPSVNSPNSQSNAKVRTPKFLSNSTPKLTSPSTPKLTSPSTPKLTSTRNPSPAPQRDRIQIPRTHSVGDTLLSPRVSKRLSRSPDTFQSPVSSGPKSKLPSPQEPKSYGPRSPTDFYKSPAVNTKSPAVRKKSPAGNAKSPADFYKSPAIIRSPAVTKPPRVTPRKSAPVLSSQTPVSLKSRVSSASTLSLPPSPLLTPSIEPPRRRGRPAGTPKSPRLAWVSPKLAPRSPPPVRADTTGIVLRREDAFNPKLFQTPKSKNRTQLETNFSPSLFDTPKSPRGSKRSVSAPHDTSPATRSESKRSKSLPISKEPRKKNTAVPEDIFCPYLFRSPRTKPVYTPHNPEDHFSPSMFRTPPTSQTSPRGVKRPLSQRGRKPTKIKRRDPRVSPEISPLLIPDPTPPETEVQRPKELLKRGVNKKSTSSPAKVVLISSPKGTAKSPVTHKLDTSSFLIRTSPRSDSASPVPIRVTRSSLSKQKNVSPTKVVLISSSKGTVKSPITHKLDTSSFLIRTSPRSDSPSPVPIRVTRSSLSKQKNVSPAKAKVVLISSPKGTAKSPVTHKLDTSSFLIRTSHRSDSPSPVPIRVTRSSLSKQKNVSPAKVVLISSPKGTAKSPVTHKLDTSSFLIRTSPRSDSPSPVPIRVTRNRLSKQKNVSPAKATLSSPHRRSIRTNNLAKDVKIISPLPKEVIEIDPLSSLRGNRQRYATSIPILLKRVVTKAERRVSSPGENGRFLRVRNYKLTAPAKGILKTPSKRQVFSPANTKIDIPVTPTVSKLHNLKKTDRKTERGRSAAVSFAAIPKRVSSRPRAPNRVLRSDKGRSIAASRNK